jgi:hypothetical protein
VLGCAFTAISPETLATVSGLLGRIDRQDDAPSVSVREVLGITGDLDGDSPGRSAQRHRSQTPKRTVFGMTRRRSEAPT